MHLSVLATALVAAAAAAVTAHTIPSPRVNNGSYAPIQVTCPKHPLVRPGPDLSQDEQVFFRKRKRVADKALARWLKKTNKDFGTANLPVIALANSGGGYRAMLVGAGVIQGLDERDSNGSTSGLLQSLTYHSGLSGGSWLLASFAGNNYPTISYLKETLWKPALEASLLVPQYLLASTQYPKVVQDLFEKQNAGYPPSLVDPWGRLLAYQLLEGAEGGIKKTMASITALSNFSSHSVPLPIITARGIKTFNNECIPGPNATMYEFTPFEFGSWENDINAFTPTEYLGSKLSGGKPVSRNSCVKKFDNLGYVLGTSSSLFNNLCAAVPKQTNSSVSIFDYMAGLLSYTHNVTTRDEYAIIPNPFYKYQSPSSFANPQNLISAQANLSLVDGGEALQVNPIVPLLQPARQIDIMIVNDNGADLPTNFPNGSEILTTYVQSFNQNLTRMPLIPSVATFLSQGLNARATFFGCGEHSKITVVYLPNFNYTFQSGTSTSKLGYLRNETEGMIANGVQVATQGGDAAWGTCLGCAVMEKTGEKLPAECQACLKKYCYYET